jgi:hypothetical protein
MWNPAVPAPVPLFSVNLLFDLAFNFYSLFRSVQLFGRPCDLLIVPCDAFSHPFCDCISHFTRSPLIFFPYSNRIFDIPAFPFIIKHITPG